LSVVVLIDGRPVDRQDLLAMRPKEVAYVEYLQTPGAEYGYDTANGAVVNFVMRQRRDGYAVGVLTNNAVTTGYGQNLAYAKYTHNDSEFAISFDSEYTALSERRIDDDDSYLIGDSWLNLTKTGINTPLRYTENTLQLGYNYFKPDRHLLDITFKGVLYSSPRRAYRQLVTEPGMADYYQYTSPYEKYISPSLNIYYKRFLTPTSALTANLVRVYRSTDYRYSMVESYAEDLSSPFSSYRYDTDGRRSAYIGEVKYYNLFSQKLGLYTGFRGAYSDTRNAYSGETDATDRLHDTNLYAFAAAYGYLGRFYYYLGVGANGRLLQQNGIRSSEWALRPQFHFTYSLNYWRFLLSGGMTQSNPSVAQLTDTEVQVNRFEATVGNPDLSDWWNYSTTFRINGYLGPIGVQNSLVYATSHRPVMGYVERREMPDGYLFVSSFDNQKRMSRVSDNLDLQMPLFAGLSFSAGAGFYSYQSRGNNYSHNLNTWNFRLAIDLTSGRWSAGFNWRSREKTLAGESLSITNAYNNLYLNYSFGQFRVGLTAQHLFRKSGPVFTELTSCSVLSKSQTVMVPGQGNMLLISLSWNLSKGKQRQESTFDFTNDDTESGILKAVK
ncbi:MAG: outer membrane beta-barrel family protein, partial [Muribaculaceae bacterium]|nr:outer membrane beta-barrel family protein [Muribaculaceae bacterium]